MTSLLQKFEFVKRPVSRVFCCQSPWPSWLWRAKSKVRLFSALLCSFYSTFKALCCSSSRIVPGLALVCGVRCSKPRTSETKFCPTTSWREFPPESAHCLLCLNSTLLDYTAAVTLNRTEVQCSEAKSERAQIRVRLTQAKKKLIEHNNVQMTKKTTRTIIKRRKLANFTRC